MCAATVTPLLDYIIRNIITINCQIRHKDEFDFGTNIAPREEQNLLHNMAIQRCVIQFGTPSGGRADTGNVWPLGILRLHWALSVGSCVRVIILVCDISLKCTECKSRSHDFKITNNPSELIPISTALFFSPWYLQHILHLPSSCSSFSFFFP